VLEDIDYVGALRRNWIAALLTLMATVVVAAVVTATRRPVYESAAQVIVAPARATAETADVIRSVETLERRTIVATFARIAASDAVHDAAAADLRLAEKDAGRFRVSGSVVSNTNIIRIEARGPNAATAARFANAAALITAREAEALYRVYTLRVLTPASAPSKPVYPDRQRNYLVGAVLGLLFGFAVALAADRVRRAPEAAVV
jgi:capsular polysaccharide biosynthesis protein